MWFSRKQGLKSPPDGVTKVAQALPKQITTKSRGDAAESAARAYLIQGGLKFIEANYRTPGRGGGEIERTGASFGGAAASIGSVKQRRIIFAARHYLMRFARQPPCRFDVVLVQGAQGDGKDACIEWLPAAFDAS